MPRPKGSKNVVKKVVKETADTNAVAKSKGKPAGVKGKPVATKGRIKPPLILKKADKAKVVGIRKDLIALGRKQEEAKQALQVASDKAKPFLVSTGVVFEKDKDVLTKLALLDVDKIAIWEEPKAKAVKGATKSANKTIADGDAPKVKKTSRKSKSSAPTEPAGEQII